MVSIHARKQVEACIPRSEIARSCCCVGLRRICVRPLEDVPVQCDGTMTAKFIIVFRVEFE
jgi:hypothetical protein